MTARLFIGDVHDRLCEIQDGTVDFILTSPPFLALRSYLPDGHPDKAKEIGSEPTPAAYLDVLLQLTAEWGRVLAPHGSIAVELGDTYAGSGGGGGDYYEDGMRAGQPGFTGSATASREELRDANARHWREKNQDKDAWPLAKSLACIPQLYQVALAYGINPLTGRVSPAGRWRVRTLKPWIRSNPPVGALGDKERPATSYVIVACRASDRWFDLDAVRNADARPAGPRAREPKASALEESGQHGKGMPATGDYHANGGAPPRDWWHHVDAILDAVKDEMPDARGVHYRRALQDAGILTTLEALDVSPKGYAGAHYAVWPPELCRLLIDEMCPRRVCIVCGEPSRRIAETTNALGYAVDHAAHKPENERRSDMRSRSESPKHAERVTLGWSDCGHGTWRPGHVLDPFAGSGTTLAVATGMARDCTGIDIDERNADLARERVGMFLDIDYGPTEIPA